MNFFINQHSEEPSLKLKLIDDARYDKDKFKEVIETAEVTMDLFEYETNKPVIFDAPCDVVYAMTKFNHQSYDNFIIHKFTKKETKNKGVFEAKINIKYTDESDVERILILPIHEKLFINVI